MKTIKVSIGQSFTRKSQGEEVKTDIMLNSTTFEVEEMPEINQPKLVAAFVNSLFKRFETREQGARLPLAITQAINLIVTIDGVRAFDLGYLSNSLGLQIKFPAHLARKDAKAARKALFASVNYAIEAAKEFDNDIASAFEA